jgi:hypothetical protein
VDVWNGGHGCNSKHGGNHNIGAIEVDNAQGGNDQGGQYGQSRGDRGEHISRNWQIFGHSAHSGGQQWLYAQSVPYMLFVMLLYVAPKFVQKLQCPKWVKIIRQRIYVISKQHVGKLWSWSILEVSYWDWTWTCLKEQDGYTCQYLLHWCKLGNYVFDRGRMQGNSIFGFLYIPV